MSPSKKRLGEMLRTMPRAAHRHSGPCEGPEGGVFCCWCDSDTHCGCYHADETPTPPLTGGGV